MDALTRALEIVGGGSRMAEAVGVTAQAVSQWRRVPAARVLAVSRATGGQVRPHELRPDLYEAPSDEGQAA